MKVDEAFPGSFLKASDLRERPVTVIIAECRLEELGSEQKPVLYFRGKDRGLVLNKTNANTIADIMGTYETDDWFGKEIVLYPDSTDFQGRRVPCIRVRAADKTTPVVTPEMLKEQTPAPAGGADDIPF